MAATASKHAFLSYVHEDNEVVDRLDGALDAGSIDVWRDTRDLWPGEDWKRKIRDAIRNGSLAFVACFSSASVNKAKTYQNEEITLAVEEVRLRQPGTQWFFPVRLDECDVPDFDLGAGHSLHNLQFTDLFGPNAQVNLIRLVTAISRLLEPTASASQVAQAIIASEDSTPSTLVDRIKTLLRDPQGDIQLEETIDTVAERASAELKRSDEYPERVDAGISDVDATLFARDWVQESEAVLRPLTEAMILGATYGGSQHSRVWTRGAEAIADLYEPSGQNLMIGLRQYPMVWLRQAVALASVDRMNFWTLASVANETRIRVIERLYPAVAVFSEARVFYQFEWIASAIAMESSESEFVIEESVVRLLKAQRVSSPRTPMSDILFAHLRPLFARLVRDDARFEALFDRASVVVDALAWDMRSQESSRGLTVWPGFGRYTWNTEYDPIEVKVAQDGALKDAMVTAGLFGGSRTRCEAAFAGLVEHVEKVRTHRIW